MFDLLENALNDATQHGRRVGVLFIDLDGFKAVNDSRVTRLATIATAVASRVAARGPAATACCRYGGDEFVVILRHVADAAALRLVADSIARRVALPYRIDGAELQLTPPSRAIYPDQACDAATLMRLADASMYRAKAEWTDPLDVQSPAPARRCDDPSKKRSLTVPPGGMLFGMGGRYS